MKNKTYSIGEVVRECDGKITMRQLRNWEDAGYIQPQRVVCGERSYRHYSEDDMVLIAEISRLLRCGFTLRSAAEQAKKSEKRNK